MFKVDRRIYRTTDGRLVEEGDTDAAFLAYAAGDEVSDAEARQVGLTALGAGANTASANASAKSRAKLADKAAPRPADKGGLMINRKEQ
jgi:hypothetical protein